jgi:uncharacterized protein
MALPANVLLKKLQEALNQAEMGLDPVEVQATLTGFIAGGIELNDKAWIQPFCQLCNDEQSLTEPVFNLTQQVYRQAVVQLLNEDFVFTPLLRDDEDADLAARLEDLSLWAQGFLTAFSMSHQDLDGLPKDIKEMIEDMAAIAQVGIDDIDDPDAERAYIELVDYVEVVVLHCFSEFAQHPETVQSIANTKKIH